MGRSRHPGAVLARSGDAGGGGAQGTYTAGREQASRVWPSPLHFFVNRKCKPPACPRLLTRPPCRRRAATGPASPPPAPSTRSPPAPPTTSTPTPGWPVRAHAMTHVPRASSGLAASLTAVLIPGWIAPSSHSGWIRYLPIPARPHPPHRTPPPRAHPPHAALQATRGKTPGCGSTSWATRSGCTTPTRPSWSTATLAAPWAGRGALACAATTPRRCARRAGGRAGGMKMCRGWPWGWGRRVGARVAGGVLTRRAHPTDHQCPVCAFAMCVWCAACR